MKTLRLLITAALLACAPFTSGQVPLLVSSIKMGATTPGTIAGSSGAITLTAAGTNKSITLTPSGTGLVTVGPVPAPYINEVDTTFATSGSIRVVGAASSFGIGSAPEGGRILTLDGTPNNAYNGFGIALDIHPTLFAIANNDGLYGIWVEPAYNDNGKSGVIHGGIMNKAPLRQDGTSVFNNTLWQKGLNTLFSFSAAALQSDSIVQIGGDVAGPGIDLGSAAGGLGGVYIAPSLGNTAGGGNTSPYNTGLTIHVNSIASAANTLTDQIGLQINVGGKDANTTITNKYGIKVFDPATSSAGGTLNIGIWNGGSLVQIGAIVPSQTVGITGTTTNNSVGAGGVGEFVESLKAIGSPQSLSNNTAANVTSISLTAGDWDVTAIGSFTETSSTVTARTAGISSTSATLPTDGSEGYCGVQSVVTSETNSITLTRKRMSLSTTTIVYLVAKANFSAGTCGGFGEISARRVR